MVPGQVVLAAQLELSVLSLMILVVSTSTSLRGFRLSDQQVDVVLGCGRHAAGQLEEVAAELGVSTICAVYPVLTEAVQR